MLILFLHACDASYTPGQAPFLAMTGTCLLRADADKAKIDATYTRLAAPHIDHAEALEAIERTFRVRT